jgi:arabinogalactan endo-1,4-beta-galactosidase
MSLFYQKLKVQAQFFYNNAKAQDMLTTLKNAGCNTIRIRLWKKSFKRTFWISRSKSISTQSKASWNESLAYRSLFRHMGRPWVQTTRGMEKFGISDFTSGSF